MKPDFIPLESIRVAKPCPADWNKMKGDDQTRFCAACAKNVYNLAAMSRAQAEQLLLEKEGNLCVQLYRRADGTVITNDCPVGLARAQRSMNAFRGLLASAVAAVLYFVGLQALGAVAKSHADQLSAWTPVETPASYSGGAVAP